MLQLFRITLSSLALRELGGKAELGALSAANKHKIHLEKLCKVVTEIRWLGIGFGWLRKKSREGGCRPRRLSSRNISSGSQQLFPVDATPGDPVARQVGEKSGRQAGLLSASCCSGQG